MSSAQISTEVQSWILQHTGASEVSSVQCLQSLWGGYGQLLRLQLRGYRVHSVILKQVLMPASAAQSSYSENRKRRSYQVERAWYADLATRCHPGCRIPQSIAQHQQGNSAWLLLEDLQTDGYHPGGPPQLEAGLRWLANFHALFLHQSPEGLWEQGSYWHLETRPEKWAALPEGPLQRWGGAVHEQLKQATHLTLVHGDSKPANFCWSRTGGAAAVDFQYVGGGCGMRDVAYFLDCCLGESGCQAQAEDWLDVYFGELHQALGARGLDSNAVEAEWRALFPLAWVDYCRFYAGWSSRSRFGAYSELQLARTIDYITRR